MQATIILYYKENTSKKQKRRTNLYYRYNQNKVLLTWRQYLAIHIKNSYAFILKKIITLHYLIVGDIELIIVANQKEVNVIFNLLYIFKVTYGILQGR